MFAVFSVANSQLCDWSHRKFMREACGPQVADPWLTVSNLFYTGSIYQTWRISGI
jgi:hypothetical protein